MIKIQKNDFFIEKEIEKLKYNKKNIGAITNFIGYVRSNNNNKKVKSVFLEVYFDMAKKNLNEIVNKAKKKWNFQDCLIIHRYGKLNVGEKIVMVVVMSKHRKDSFLSCQFIMNYLKKEAPIWKKENYSNEFKWLENTRLKN